MRTSSLTNLKRGVFSAVRVTITKTPLSETNRDPILSRPTRVGRPVPNQREHLFRTVLDPATARDPGGQGGFIRRVGVTRVSDLMPAECRATRSHQAIRSRFFGRFCCKANIAILLPQLIVPPEK